MTTAPTNVCPGDLVNISATSLASRMDWYDAATGGNLLGYYVLISWGSSVELQPCKKATTGGK